MINEDNVRITITIPKSLLRLLKKDSEYEDRSVSNFVSRILKAYYNIRNDD